MTNATGVCKGSLSDSAKLTAAVAASAGEVKIISHSAYSSLSGGSIRSSISLAVTVYAAAAAKRIRSISFLNC